MGAADPTSGTVSLHEVIKGFGTLLRNGWKPLRNIVIASWDAEEVIGKLFVPAANSYIAMDSTALSVARNSLRTSLSGYLRMSSHISTWVRAR